MSLTSANQVETNKYELTVSVNKEQFENAINQVYRKNVKQISIPGFRKGKAPRKTIERLYGEGFFYEEAVNLLYPEMYDEAVKEAGVVPVSQPDVEIEQVSEEGFTFKATVFVRPEIEVKNYKGIAVDKVIKEASEQDVAESLRKCRTKTAGWFRLRAGRRRWRRDGDRFRRLCGR
ncbi:MAG: trigger factor family protein [Oscillospiraceae bacterium]